MDKKQASGEGGRRNLTSVDHLLRSRRFHEQISDKDLLKSVMLSLLITILRRN